MNLEEDAEENSPWGSASEGSASGESSSASSSNSDLDAEASAGSEDSSIEPLDLPFDESFWRRDVLAASKFDDARLLAETRMTRNEFALVLREVKSVCEAQDQSVVSDGHGLMTLADEIGLLLMYLAHGEYLVRHPLDLPPSSTGSQATHRGIWPRFSESPWEL
jgi:hypothetical protein